MNVADVCFFAHWLCHCLSSLFRTYCSWTVSEYLQVNGPEWDIRWPLFSSVLMFLYLHPCLLRQDLSVKICMWRSLCCCDLPLLSFSLFVLRHLTGCDTQYYGIRVKVLCGYFTETWHPNWRTAVGGRQLGAMYSICATLPHDDHRKHIPAIPF